MAELLSLKTSDLSGLVNRSQLETWLDECDLSRGEPVELRRISGGLSNETIGVNRGGGRWVLRRPAKRALDGADRGMRREYRILAALADTNVPLPTPVALCEDTSVAGCVFYLMDFLEGFVPGRDLPVAYAESEALRREVVLSGAEVLGRIARVDWRSRGLADFGRPEGFHDRQVTRWLRQLESYPDERERDLGDLERVGVWLEGHRPGPAEWTPAIMHGDFHLGNLLVGEFLPPRIVAVLDWENATIGDPLLDLAGFQRLLVSTGQGGWARADEIVEAWESSSGRRAPDLRYYTVLSAFKLSVMLEGIFRRSIVDPTRGRSDEMGTLALRAMNEAVDALRA